MPKTWAPEALKAQAVAARSYALSHLHAAAGFDLYPDTRDQVYLGIPHEAPSTNAAVNATAGQVVLYKGKVASTYFFSTSGGRTASVQDLYPDSPPVPYLVSVPDPYDSISPYHDWGPFRYTARKLARGLKSPGKLLDVKTVAASSGRVQSVVATGSKGEATATGNEVRSALGLRSTWFQVGVLALGAPTTPLTYGTATALSGTARGVSSVELQQLGSAGDWQTVSTLTPRGGSVAPRVKPQQSSQFRLAVGKIASDPVPVAVAPSVRLHVPAQLTGFWGAVKPAAATGDMQTINLFSLDPNRPGYDPTGWVQKEVLGRMPLPNDWTIGDGLNTAGIRFVRRMHGYDTAAYLGGGSPDVNRNQFNVRIDHNFNATNKVAVTYTWEHDDGLANLATLPDTFGGSTYRRPQQLSANLISTSSKPKSR